MANMPTSQQHKQLIYYAQTAHKSGMFSFNSAEEALTYMLTGFELGFGPMASIRFINKMGKRLEPASEALLALVFRAYPNAPIDIKEFTSERCVISAARPGREQRDFVFTMDDADKAGLTKMWDKKKSQWVDNPVYKKFGKNMLKARCVSNMVTALFPELTTGLVKHDLDEPEVDKVTDLTEPAVNAEEVLPAPEPVLETSDAHSEETIKQMRKGIVELMKEKKVKPEDLRQKCIEWFNEGSFAELNYHQLDQLAQELMALPAPVTDAPPQTSKALSALERAKRGEPVTWNEPAPDHTEPKAEQLKNYAPGAH